MNKNVNKFQYVFQMTFRNVNEFRKD